MSTLVLTWIIAFVITEAVLLLIYYIYVESTGFKITTYELTTTKKLPKKLNLVMLTDLHDTKHGKDNEKLLEAIDEIAPDFVICAGDMITSYMQPKYNSDNTFEFLKRLSKKYRIIYGLGNHEQRYLVEPEKFHGKFKELEKFVKELGIDFLNNESVRLDEYNCTIYGLNVPIENYARVVTKPLENNYAGVIFGKSQEEAYNILLAHTPDYFDNYCEFEPDLICSGHVHGGIVGVPYLGGLLSPQLKLFPKYDAGLFKKNNTTMVLGRGIGWHTIPVRINNKAEVIRICIKNNLD